MANGHNGHKPILLRPTTDLADAIAKAAEKAGCSRQQWMLTTLTNATTVAGTLTSDLPEAQDEPLPGV